ncbi:MAG: hypothetical protein KF752_11650 [Pirellulaceae bacterium]|nr:hypothetical protein [Pirellulaceae bacterium]
MTKYRFYRVKDGIVSSEKYVGLRCNYLGQVRPGAPDTWLYRRFNRPVAVQQGYLGLYADSGFLQGPCVNLKCDKGDSEFLFSSWSGSATINQEFESSFTWTNIDDVTVMRLPLGFYFSIEDGVCTITGTPQEPGIRPGTYWLLAVGKTRENSCHIFHEFSITIVPCDHENADIDIGELPEATEFEPWFFEIPYTDVKDTGPDRIEITGLPEEIEVTIEDGVITLQTDELPATSGWIVTIRGRTIPNDCLIEKEFLLRILPCDSANATIYSPVLINDNVVWQYALDPEGGAYCYRGMHNTLIIPTVDVQDLTATGLPSWLEFSFQSGAGVISGAPPTDNCAVHESAITGATPTPGYSNRYHWDVVLSGLAQPNDCTIRRTIRVYLQVNYCMHPSNYPLFGIDIVARGVGEEDPWVNPRVINSIGSSINEFLLSNCTWDRLEGSIPGFVLSIDPDTSAVYYTRGFDPETPPGTYIITLVGRVSSGVFGGAFAGCRIDRTYTVIITP